MLCVNYENGIIAVCNDCAERVLRQFACNVTHGALDDVVSTCTTGCCVRHEYGNVTSVVTCGTVTRLVENAHLMLHVGLRAGPMVVKYKNGTLLVCVECTKNVLTRFARNEVRRALEEVVACHKKHRAELTDARACGETPLLVHVFSAAFTASKDAVSTGTVDVVLPSSAPTGVACTVPTRPHGPAPRARRPSAPRASPPCE